MFFPSYLALRVHFKASIHKTQLLKRTVVELTLNNLGVKYPRNPFINTASEIPDFSSAGDG